MNNTLKLPKYKSLYKLDEKVIVSGEATGVGDKVGHIAEIHWETQPQEYFYFIIGAGARVYVQEKFLKRVG